MAEMPTFKTVSTSPDFDKTCVAWDLYSQYGVHCWMISSMHAPRLSDCMLRNYAYGLAYAAKAYSRLWHPARSTPHTTQHTV